MLKDLIIASDRSRSVDSGMLADVAATTDFHLRSDNGIGRDGNVFSDFCRRIDNRSGVNHQQNLVKYLCSMAQADRKKTGHFG